MDTTVISMCEEFASKFSSERIAQSIADVKRRIVATKKTSVALVGQSIAQINELLEAVLGMDVLSEIDVRFIEKSCHIHLTNEPKQGTFIKEKKYYIGDNNEEASADEVKRMLNDPNTAKILLTVCIPDHRLDEVGIDLITSTAHFSDFNWKEEFSREDFIFFTTNAFAALPIAEKRYISECAVPMLGQGRMAVVLLGTDKLQSDEDMNSVMQFVSKFFSGLGVECDVFPSDVTKLKDYIYNVILSRSKELKAIMGQQAVKYCCGETLDALNEMLSHADLDVEMLEKAAKELEDKRGGMKLKGEIAALEAKRNMRNTLLEDIGTIREHADRVTGSIQEGLDKADDPEVAKQNIPEYLRNVWEDFTAQYSESMQKKSKAVLDSAFDRLEGDVSDFITNISNFDAGGIKKILNGVHINGRVINIDSSESDTKTKIDEISKILMISAVPAALLIGLPAGILALGGSFVISPLMKSKINADTKEAAMIDVRESCSAISENLKRDITSQIDKLADETEKLVLEAYEQVVSAIVHALDKKIELSKAAKQNREEIKQAIEALSNAVAIA